MTSPISLKDVVRVFARIGVLSFGGPAAQISLMHEELVERQKFLTEQEFLRALSLCMLLPGPEAMQLATYAGWRIKGTLGGIVAGGLFVVPGALVIALLATLYVRFGSVPLVQSAFEGVKAAVIIIVMQALLKVSSKALTAPPAWVLAAGAFVALFIFQLPYPLVVVCAAGIGALAFRTTPASATEMQPTASNPISVLLLWGALWAAPVGLIAALDAPFLMQVALFFSKLAVVTFGGAYAVLAYMTQTVVADYEWLTTAQMIDALGLAETTPGPLILVTQFVAMLAGFYASGPLMAFLAGVTALWVTFIPCFLWIFLSAPYLERITNRPRLSGALSAITAAVVGVILNLALWFAIHVLFSDVQFWSFVASPLPVLASLNARALVLTLVAGILLLWLRRGIAETLALAAVTGMVLSAV